MKKFENADTLLDISFRAAKDSANRSSAKYRRSKPLVRTKKTEQRRLEIAKKTINNRLRSYNKDFPSIDRLPLFYNRLMHNCLDIDNLRQSLGSLKWCVEKINELYKPYNAKLAKAQTKDQMIAARKGFYGRFSSLLKRINKHLLNLESARKTMKQFPDIKDGMQTIAIAGYPNVGKSSLLKALTSSKPEIASYAFTTKKLNVGYMQTGKKSENIADNRDKRKNIQEIAVEDSEKITD